MSPDRLADELKRHDRLRWVAARTVSDPVQRDVVVAHFMFNLEIARIPWVSAEPLVGRIRLQWWHDAIADLLRGEPRDEHPILAIWSAHPDLAIPAMAPFSDMISMREGECARPVFSEPDDLARLADQSTGALLELVARTLGADDAQATIIRTYGAAVGISNYLGALPAFAAQNYQPVRTPGLVHDAACLGQEKLGLARRDRRAIPATLHPAILPGALVDTKLAQARANPEQVLQQGMRMSPFQERRRLVWIALTGRW